MKKIVVLFIVLLLCISSIIAQENCYMAKNPPRQNEVVLNNGARTKNGYSSLQSAYKAALREAQQTNPGKNIGIRNLSKGEIKIFNDGSVSNYYNYSVVELPSIVVQKLITATNKATRKIDDGCRFVVENISITDGKTDRESIRGQLIDLLLSKGYKVVKKEQISSMGYSISVRITDAYIQVQVVNISTGEYEGNVTEAL